MDERGSPARIPASCSTVQYRLKPDQRMILIFFPQNQPIHASGLPDFNLLQPDQRALRQRNQTDIPVIALSVWQHAEMAIQLCKLALKQRQVDLGEGFKYRI